jgi:drug/metabolite transporter (DMT)-like permease
MLIKYALEDFSPVEAAFFQAALGNYLTPIFALFYGVILLGEPLTIAAIAGLALIIVGAEITLRGDSAKRAGGKAKAHKYRPHPPFH